MSNIGILTVPPLLEVFTSGDNLNLLLDQVLLLNQVQQFLVFRAVLEQLQGLRTP